MGFLGLSLKNLLRHRIRTLLTLSGIAASVAVLFSILSFNKGFDRGLSREIQRTGLHFLVVPSGCAHEVASLVLHGSVIPKFLDTAVMEKVRGTEGVELVTPIIVAQLPNSRRGRIDLVYGAEMSVLGKIKPSWKIEGKIPSSEKEILLGSEVARHGDVRPGDRISSPHLGEEFTVTGIIGKTGSQDDAFIYMPIAKVQALLKRPSGATAIGVTVKRPELLPEITERLASEAPGIQIVTMGQVMNSVSNLAASAKVMSLSIAFIAVFISAVGVMNSILMAVFERTQEIGMMRAIGASRLDLFRIIVVETVFLTMAGGGAGIILSVLGNDLIEAFVRKVMPYVPSGEMVRFEPGIALGSLIFSLVVGVIAGLYPAWRASRINPMEAIRG